MKTLGIERKEKLRKWQNIYLPDDNAKRLNRINTLIHDRKRKKGISRTSLNLFFVILFLVIIAFSIYYGLSMMI